MKQQYWLIYATASSKLAMQVFYILSYKGDSVCLAYDYYDCAYYSHNAATYLGKYHPLTIEFYKKHNIPIIEKKEEVKAASRDWFGPYEYLNAAIYKVRYYFNKRDLDNYLKKL